MQDTRNAILVDPMNLRSKPKVTRRDIIVISLPPDYLQHDVFTLFLPYGTEVGGSATFFLTFTSFICLERPECTSLSHWPLGCEKEPIISFLCSCVWLVLTKWLILFCLVCSLVDQGYRAIAEITYEGAREWNSLHFLPAS